MVNKILEYGLSVPYFTKSNFAGISDKAKSYEGSLKQVEKDFKVLGENGFVRPLPLDRRTRETRLMQFHYITQLGAERIDREDEWKPKKEYKAVSRIEHDSILIDFCFQVLKRMPEATFIFNYKSGAGKHADVFVKDLNLIVEIERKREPGKVLQEARKYGPDFKQKVLFIWARNCQDAFIRPTQLKPEHYEEARQDMESLLEAIKKSKFNWADRFLFTHYYQLWNLDRDVISTNKGRTKLF
jgi:hypothetical protein